jgi:hypothetical protein
LTNVACDRIGQRPARCRISNVQLVRHGVAPGLVDYGNRFHCPCFVDIDGNDTCAFHRIPNLDALSVARPGTGDYRDMALQ